MDTQEQVKQPAHYTQHPEGVECIQLAGQLMFNQGNAVKYLWRAGLKGPALVDLQKARQYVVFAIEMRPALVRGELTPLSLPGDELVAKAAKGFPPLVAAAITLIANDVFEVALQMIDQLIAESEET